MLSSDFQQVLDDPKYGVPNKPFNSGKYSATVKKFNQTIAPEPSSFGPLEILITCIAAVSVCILVSVYARKKYKESQNPFVTHSKSLMDD